MRLPQRANQQGSILFVTMIMAVVVGLMLAAYLTMVGSQNRFTHRSQVWNNVIPVCEAGVEEALAHMNYGGKTNFAAYGWVFTNNAYTKSRTLDDGQVEMSISTAPEPVITVKGFVVAPLQTNFITRTVQVKTKINHSFPQAILAKGLIKTGGNGVINSFNSTNAAYSTGGNYDPLKATDHATVATNSKNPGDLDIGNVTIYGKVATGPGGSLNLGNGIIGDTAWASDPAHKGMVEPGFIANDLNIYIPDVRLPSSFMPLIPAPGVVGGVVYTFVIPAGDWVLDTLILTSGMKVLITGKARLYVRGDTSLTSDAAIIIASGGSIDYYSGGTLKMAGQGCINSTGRAINFSLYGLNTCTTLEYTGTSQFVGTIYAPRANVKVAGTADMIGAIVANTLDLSGGMGVHYDEALRGDPREGRYVVASWIEL